MATPYLEHPVEAISAVRAVTASFIAATKDAPRLKIGQHLEDLLDLE